MGSASLCHGRNFSQRQPVNRCAFLPKKKPKFALRQITISVGGCKADNRSRDPFDLSKVTKVIGRDINGAILFECGMNGVHEIWRHYAAPIMTSFWPRIGKQEIK